MTGVLVLAGAWTVWRWLGLVVGFLFYVVAVLRHSRTPDAAGAQAVMAERPDLFVWSRRWGQFVSAVVVAWMLGRMGEVW